MHVLSLQPWSSASVSVSVMDSSICSGLAPEPASPVTTLLPFSPVTHKITQIHHTCTWASAQASPPPGWVAAAFILPHLPRSPSSLHKNSALQEPQTVLSPPSTELVLPPVILLLCPLSSVVWLFPGRWTYVCLFIPKRIPMTDRPNNFIQVYFSDAVV